MAWDGNGNFTRTIDWTDDRDAGTKILASRHDTNDNELVTGIGACLTKNNETKPTADFKPNADDSYSLGSSALRWVNGWLKALKLKTGSTYVGTLQSTNLTADRTIELPDAAGTIAVLPVADTQTIVKGSADATKLLRIEVDGLTTGTTRVMTIPDADFTPMQVNLIDAAGDLIYGTAADTAARLAIGTARQVLRVNSGATAPAWDAQITLGTPQASTSGTAIDFTSIPSGTKRITIMGIGVSTNGTDNFVLQLGDAGGVETSGYTGGGFNQSGAYNTISSYLRFWEGGLAAGGTYDFQIDLSLEDSSDNTWSAKWTAARTDAASCTVGCGSKATSAVLDRVRITTTAGANTFDAGEINIAYE